MLKKNQLVGNWRKFYNSDFHTKIEIWEQSEIDIANILFRKKYKEVLQKRRDFIFSKLVFVYDEPLVIPDKFVSETIFRISEIEKDLGISLNEAAKIIRKHLSFHCIFVKKDKKIVKFINIVNAYKASINNLPKSEVLRILYE